MTLRRARISASIARDSGASVLIDANGPIARITYKRDRPLRHVGNFSERENVDFTISARRTRAIEIDSAESSRSPNRACIYIYIYTRNV